MCIGAPWKGLQKKAMILIEPGIHNDCIFQDDAKTQHSILHQHLNYPHFNSPKYDGNLNGNQETGIKRRQLQAVQKQRN